MPAVCADIRVLDLSLGPVGGVASMVLADFGAEVLKLEPSGGDPWRSLAAASVWLRGKQSLVADLTQPDGQARLRELAQGADVVIASYKPGEAESLGADYAALSAANPGLIYCSITGWGPVGPYAQYPAYEGVVAAKSGRMTRFGEQLRRDGPAYAAVRVASHAAAQAAVQGVLSALIARERSGRGQLVEASLLQGLMPYDPAQLLLTQLSGVGALQPFFDDEPYSLPMLHYMPMPTADGRWIQPGNLLDHLFLGFLGVIGLGAFLGKERFLGEPDSWSLEAKEEMRDAILLRMQEKTVDEWMQIFRDSGDVAAEPYTSTVDALDNVDMLANGDVVTIEDPGIGSVRQVGPLGQLRRTPAVIERPAPGLGEHDGTAWPAREPLIGAALPKGKPLDGITILEFATIIATPLGLSMLADLGARVIKVEPIGGDPYRSMDGAGLLAVKTNAGKESICINLKDPEGQQLAQDLIRDADALVHNYRPGVTDRLGIGYEQAREINPSLVWVSANGYGPDSPGARRPSTHPIPGAAIGGALNQAGADVPPAVCNGLAEIREVSRLLMQANEVNPDPNTAAVIASATLLGLLAERRYGDGQAIFVNMLAANAYANVHDFVDYEGKPAQRLLDGEVFGTGALDRIYPAADGWVFLCLPLQLEWEAFCTAIDRADLAAEVRFADAAAREANDAALADALRAVFAQRVAAEWEALLAPQGLGCVAVTEQGPGDFFVADPHVEANGFVRSATHARFGTVKRWGPVVVCDGGRQEYGPGVLAGQDADSILAELGRDAAETRRLRDQGVVWSEPVEMPSPAG